MVLRSKSADQFLDDKKHILSTKEGKTVDPREVTKLLNKARAEAVSQAKLRPAAGLKSSYDLVSAADKEEARKRLEELLKDDSDLPVGVVKEHKVKEEEKVQKDKPDVAVASSSLVAVKEEEVASYRLVAVKKEPAMAEPSDELLSTPWMQRGKKRVIDLTDSRESEDEGPGQRPAKIPKCEPSPKDVSSLDPHKSEPGALLEILVQFLTHDYLSTRDIVSIKLLFRSLDADNWCLMDRVQANCKLINKMAAEVILERAELSFD